MRGTRVQAIPSTTVMCASGSTLQRWTSACRSRWCLGRGVITSTSPRRSKPGMPRSAAADLWDAAATGPLASTIAHNRCSQVAGRPGYPVDTLGHVLQGAGPTPLPDRVPRVASFTELAVRHERVLRFSESCDVSVHPASMPDASDSHSPTELVPQNGARPRCVEPVRRTWLSHARRTLVGGASVQGRQRLLAGRGPAAGDRRAGRGDRAGRPVPDPAGHHRQRQERHHRLDHRAGPAAHAGHRPQQVPRRPAGQRVPRVLPREPGRVLRVLLRLLPARGLHPVERHLHREGLEHQRRDRPPAPQRHVGPPRPAGTSSSWPACPASTAWARPRSTPTRSSASSRARSTPSGPSSAGWSTCSTSATTSTSPGASSGCGATPSRCSPPTRRWASASSCSATRSSASAGSTPSPASTWAT